MMMSVGVVMIFLTAKEQQKQHHININHIVVNPSLLNRHQEEVKQNFGFSVFSIFPDNFGFTTHISIDQILIQYIEAFAHTDTQRIHIFLSDKKCIKIKIEKRMRRNHKKSKTFF